MNKLPSGTVTFLFTDIEDSTRLWQEYPELMAQAHALHDQILYEAAAAHDGHVFQIVGDSFSVAFHNVQDALMAALTAQRELTVRQEESMLKLKVRMGVHTGSAVIQGDGKYDGYVTLASTQRVMSVAHGGQMLLSQATASLVQDLPAGVFLADLGRHQLKSLREPMQLYQLNAHDFLHDFPPLQTLNIHPNNLPSQLTSFIGREKQLDDLTHFITDNRMVTLMGPGGTGKTRLSLQLGETQLLHFKHGVWFLELAAITDPAYITPAVAAVFNLREVQGMPLRNVLLDYFRGKQLLLLFDNCEHLVDACAELADQLLRECAGLKIVASSREALGINGEVIYKVPSLKEGEAVRLFIERATKADSRFQATDSNTSFILQICSRLDGIPLAIELAAARVKLFPPKQIAERLDNRFKLLTGGSRTALPRQQTLHALIDWSYQTLNETEQRTFRRLAVFSGGWTFDAAEVVVGEFETMDGLAGLVNKSLVTVEDRDGTSRYNFLETIRQYAIDKLVEAGESNEIRSRHLKYVMEFMTDAESAFYGLDRDWLDRIDRERDNLRAALEWALDNKIEEAIRLALKIGTYWSTRDHISEALYWYRAILQKSETLTALDDERAAIYTMLGWASILIGQHREGRAAAQMAITLTQRSPVGRTLVFASCTLALASVFLGDIQTAEKILVEFELVARERNLKEELALLISTRAQVVYFSTRDGVKAKTYLDEAIQLTREVGYRWETAFQTFGQARLAATLGDIETARMKFNEGTEFARRVGNSRMVFSNQSELAHVLREHGRLDEALAIYKEVIPGWRELGHRAALAHELECIGYILASQEEPEKALQLIGAAQTIRKEINMPRTQLEEGEYQAQISALMGLLNKDEFEMYLRAGENLAMDEAMELALSTA